MKADDQHLTQAIADAKKLAAEWRARIYIIRCHVYADEYSESPFVVGGKEACLMLYPKKRWMKEEDWKLCGCVDPDGSTFLTNIEDTLKQLFS